MARLFRTVYFKATCNSKLCSYATKPNPYTEVLKTLRTWEEDLRRKNKNLLEEVSYKEHLQKQSSPASKNLNVHNESSHLNQDSMITNSPMTENVSGHLSSEQGHGTEDFRLPKVEDAYDKLLPPIKNTIAPPFSSKHVTHHSQAHVKNLVKDSKARTTNKTDSESAKTKKKKYKQLKKQSKLSENDERTSSSRNLSSNLLSSSDLNKLSSNLNLKSAQNVNNITNNEKMASHDGKNKNFNHYLKTTAKLDKKLIELPNSDHLSNETPVDEIKCTHDDLKLKDAITLSSGTKTKSGNISGKEKSKTKTKSKSSKTKEKSQISAIMEDRKLKAKQEDAAQSLRSIIEARINVDEVDRAYTIFVHLVEDEKKKMFADSTLYNIMLFGLARKGWLDKVENVLAIMEKEKIAPTLQSFASYLEAISRSKCIDLAEVSAVVCKMKLHGFTPKDLLKNCIFIGDQREKVIEVLGYVERDLNLPLYVPGKAYSYELLEKLNDKNYEKAENHFDFCFQAEDILKLSTEQMEIEEKSSVRIKSVDAVLEPTDKMIKCREYIKECENMWRKRLTKAINNLKTPKKHQGILGSSPSQAVYPYLVTVDTDVLVDLLLQETRMLAETAEFYSPNIRCLYRDLGLKVMKHYYMVLNKKNNITKKVHFIYQKYLEYLLDYDLCAQYSPREYWEFLKSKYADGPTIDVPNSAWPYTSLVYIGSILYDMLRNHVCFNPNRITRKSDSNFMYPAFNLVYEQQTDTMKVSRQIRATDLFVKLYRDAKLEHLDFDVSLVPMLSPPRPWMKHDSGGLIIAKVPFVRFPEQARSQSSYYSNVPQDQLNPCFDSLNNLALCPWIINKPILDIVIKIFQDGGSEELDIPLNPANFTLDPSSLEVSEENNNKMAYRHWMQYEKKKGEMTSLWYDCLYKLSIANHFRDRVFWFPHNLDFRGRVYPTPPHFNHLGSDLSRSILVFASGKPLGEKGLDWLKIHLINLTGFKKRAPHAERLAYANEVLPEILDSADNPFGEKRWWMTSDTPLQTLACCMEVAKAVRHPNPAEYVSHFPVHQDGSCNGLQHYAALGRDELGAIEVNLHPSSAPQDVYSGVAALVEKEREKDAKIGLEVAQVLEGFIRRKVVKQTVMTFVYGVTPYGARLQVLKQLKDIPEFPEKHQQAAATYLMKKIFLSIKEMFTATKKIQDWFTECAETITRVTSDPVEWVTPLGLPVIQPYYVETTVRSSKFCISKGDKENINNYSSKFEPYQLPNVRKQKNAFAPNFIHSLDSTHMMLTSLFCHRKGVTFVSVHDCYWTHASTVEIMNKICREQFVSLHSEPILENLSAFFLERYANNPEKYAHLSSNPAMSKMREILSAVPEKGTFDLQKVLNSEYFFS